MRCRGSGIRGEHSPRGVRSNAILRAKGRTRDPVPAGLARCAHERGVRHQAGAGPGPGRARDDRGATHRSSRCRGCPPSRRAATLRWGPLRVDLDATGRTEFVELSWDPDGVSPVYRGLDLLRAPAEEVARPVGASRRWLPGGRRLRLRVPDRALRVAPHPSRGGRRARPLARVPRRPVLGDCRRGPAGLLVMKGCR